MKKLTTEIFFKTVHAINFLILPVFIKKYSSKNDDVIKVLHISSFSHKPFILTRKLREYGIKADFLAMNTDRTYLHMGEDAYDYAIPSARTGLVKRIFRSFYALWFILPQYDIFHIYFQSCIFPDFNEYRQLKRLGKKFIFHFRGCDIRQKSINKKLHPDLNCCQECDYPDNACENEHQKMYLEIVKEVGDAFFVTTPDLLDFAPPSTCWLLFVPPPEEVLRAIIPEQRDENIFRVVTSSNHDGVDGTAYVRDAIEKLKKDGFEIELVELNKTPYKKTLALYASADVYVGKLRMGYYNNANIESMLLGVPCISYIRPELREKHCPECPIIQATPETVYETLKSYINRRDELKIIGKKSRKFILEAHKDEYSIIPLIETYKNLLKAS